MVSAWRADTKDTLPVDTTNVFCSSGSISHKEDASNLSVRLNKIDTIFSFLENGTKFWALSKYIVSTLLQNFNITWWEQRQKKKFETRVIYYYIFTPSSQFVTWSPNLEQSSSGSRPPMLCYYTAAHKHSQYIPLKIVYINKEYFILLNIIIGVLYSGYREPSVMAQQILIWLCSLRQTVGEPNTSYQIWFHCSWLKGRDHQLKRTKFGHNPYQSFYPPPPPLNGCGWVEFYHLSALFELLLITWLGTWSGVTPGF
jgi:hypothetical protein